MIDLLRSRKLSRGKQDSLSEIAKIKDMEKDNSANQRMESLILKKFDETGLEERMKDIDRKLDDVYGKVEELVFLYQSNSREKQPPSVRKVRVKDVISALLDQHGSLSAPQLCKMLNLSRTRCSEYLKEMEGSGFLDAKLNCRKKFYSVRQKGK
jgi:predicted transcriptional regulator